MLESKKILVMGAGGLLGASLVKKIIELGGVVIAADFDIDGLAERLLPVGKQASLHQVVEVDVTSKESVQRLFTSIEGLDGVVNCTYPRGKGYGAHFFDVELEDFNQNVALHLGSSFLLMQQAARYFVASKQPLSLVNISSIYGVVAPKFDVYDDTSMTMPVEYAAIKSAIIHLNKYVAKYVKDSRFRVNSVSPGGIYDGQPNRFCEKYRGYTNGAGMLDVDAVLGAVCFLLGDSSAYMTGQNLVDDDGFSI